jgi:hypothetical protein
MPRWANGWRHYREKYDRSFSRFFLSPDGNTWRVQAKGGTVTEFGRPLYAPELTAEDEATDRDSLASGASPVYRWLLSRQFDAQGNLVVYRWKIEDSGRRVLTDIWDTPAVGVPLALSHFAHHVELQWEGYPFPTVPRYARIDRARLGKHLKRIFVSSMPLEESGPREVTRIYHLDYLATRSHPYDPSSQAPLFGHSFLRSIQTEGRCGTSEDFLGHAPTSFGCPRLPPVTFTYEPGTIHGGSALVSVVQSASSNAPSKPAVLDTLSSATVLDINGDGLPDIVQSWRTEAPPTDYVDYNVRALFGYINLGFSVGLSRPLLN